MAQASALYSTALELAREERFEDARQVFERVITECPSWQKPWVSYAQMEKRAAMKRGQEQLQYDATVSADKWNRCREVLLRALHLNPHSAKIIQAWGLMELQKGNLLSAVKLLERCATYDPQCAPVLRWKPVKEAAAAMVARQQMKKQTKEIIS